jgi:hypothetical protein
MVGTVTIAGGQVFIEEQVSEENFGEWEQTIVDIDSGSKDPQTALEKFGGSVVGGSVSGGEAGSVFVSRLDLDHADDIGLFRTAPDGSDGELLTTNPFVDLLVERGDSWVFVDPGGIGDPILVEQYRPGQGVTLLGCIDGDQTTAHALSLQNDEPVVAIFRTDNSVILKVQ